MSIIKVRRGLLIITFAFVRISLISTLVILEEIPPKLSNIRRFKWNILRYQRLKRSELRLKPGLIPAITQENRPRI